MSRRHLHFPAHEPASLSVSAHSTTVSIQFTPWSFSVSLPKFDEAAMGKLWRVELSLALTFRSFSRVENVSPIAAPVTVSGARLDNTTFTVGSTVVYVENTLEVSFTNSLAAYDGLADYGGSSGVSNARRSSTATRVAEVTNKADVTGSGNFTVDISAAAVGFVTGPSNWLQQINPDLGVTVTVRYYYQPQLVLSGISGLCWDDFNANGVLEPGEPGLAGVSVVLYNSVSAVVGTALTDSSGLYQFVGLTPGDYAIAYYPPDLGGYYPTWDPSGVPVGGFLVTVGAGTTADQNIGFSNLIP